MTDPEAENVAGAPRSPVPARDLRTTCEAGSTSGPGASQAAGHSDPALQQRERARAVLDALGSWAQCDPGLLPAGAKGEALEAVQRAKARLAAIELRLVSQADDAARATGHRDAAAWYAATARTDPGMARAAQHTARSLASAPQVAADLGNGVVSERHARVILDALDALPPVPTPLRKAAEARLLTHARHLPPRQLALRGRAVLDEIDPSGAHRQLERALADEASRAWAATRIAFHDKGDGTTDVEGTLPTPVASRLRTVLDSYASPRARHASDRDALPRATTGTGVSGTNLFAPPPLGPVEHGVVVPHPGEQSRDGQGHVEPGSAAHGPAAHDLVPGGRLPHATRLGHALCTLLEGLDPSDLPRHGGAATTVIVTIDRQALDDDLGTALLIDGGHEGGRTPMSAGEARRLACTSGVLPAVLDGASQVLDLGRRARLFTPAQVTALRLRDGGCRGEGCTIPAAWCEAHHLDPWSSGGATDLSNGVLLCSHHHHPVHDPTYEHAWQHDGSLRFRLGSRQLTAPPRGGRPPERARAA